ncbi:oleate hydratase, partial [Mordavella massiliensis]|nr:oleate hydratase [Mordavella massiliensis]
GLPTLSALKFNKYNQYESMTKPVLAYLQDHNVDIQYDTVVNNVLVDTSNDKKIAKKILLTKDGKDEEIVLTDNDYVFVTNGSITESSTYGDQNTPAPITHSLGPSWKLWENLSYQDAD